MAGGNDFSYGNFFVRNPLHTHLLRASFSPKLSSLLGYIQTIEVFVLIISAS